jgi:hypothetical protein
MVSYALRPTSPRISSARKKLRIVLAVPLASFPISNFVRDSYAAAIRSPFKVVFDSPSTSNDVLRLLTFACHFL